MIESDGWSKFSPWEHSAGVNKLYDRRARGEEGEMTCHRQAVDLLAPHLQAGDSLIDIGCGTGYFYHSLAKRKLQVEYFGVDANPHFIESGRKILEPAGLAPAHLISARWEDLRFEVDHAVSINMISHVDNFQRPLERMLRGARKTVVLRESFAPQASYLYVRDEYLDPEVNLSVHINTYAESDVEAFVRSHGFSVTWITDEFTGGKPQMIIGYPHHWKFLLAVKESN